MKIIRAKKAGFCFGVKRAVDIALAIQKEEKKGVYTLGPIIHNPQVVQRLEEAGIKPLDINKEIPDDARAIIVRTHGVTRKVYEKLSKLNIKIIDATCPFVKKAQQYAKLLHEEGYQVIILGDAEHPEVKGIKSYTGDDTMIISEPVDTGRLKSRIGIIVQTTQPVDKLEKLVSRCVGQVKEMKVYNTICNSTALRLKEAQEIAEKVDLMLVVGGRNSANTTQLAGFIKSLGVMTYHIESACEIEDEWFEKVNTTGVTAGASTPDWIIDEVVERLRRQSTLNVPDKL